MSRDRDPGAGDKPPATPPDRTALAIAELAVGTARFVARLVPARVKKRVEDGIFHYIFQKTRVENDAYGWRPDTPPGGEPPPEPGADPEQGPGRAR